MEKLKHKLKDRGGFTLVEMLVVVAIIAILIAVSIPMVNAALEKAREAVDASNERNARSLASIMYLTADKKKDTTSGPFIGTDGGEAFYSVGNGKTDKDADTTTGTLVGKYTDIKGGGYGKGTLAGDVSANNVGLAIKVTVAPPTGTETEPTISIEWVDPTTGAAPTT